MITPPSYSDCSNSKQPNPLRRQHQSGHGACLKQLRKLRLSLHKSQVTGNMPSQECKGGSHA
jgi:hypothetical protein